MEIKLAGGSVLFLNNLLAFCVIVPALIYFCMSINNKKFDKALHSGISAFLTFVFLNVLALAHLGWWWGPITVVGIGFAKEFSDLINPQKKLFDWTDIMADLIGCGSITFGYVFMFLVK